MTQNSSWDEYAPRPGPTSTVCSLFGQVPTQSGRDLSDQLLRVGLGEGFDAYDISPDDHAQDLGQREPDPALGLGAIALDEPCLNEHRDNHLREHVIAQHPRDLLGRHGRLHHREYTLATLRVLPDREHVAEQALDRIWRRTGDDTRQHLGRIDREADRLDEELVLGGEVVMYEGRVDVGHS